MLPTEWGAAATTVVPVSRRQTAGSSKLSKHAYCTHTTYHGFTTSSCIAGRVNNMRSFSAQKTGKTRNTSQSELLLSLFLHGHLYIIPGTVRIWPGGIYRLRHPREHRPKPRQIVIKYTQKNARLSGVGSSPNPPSNRTSTCTQHHRDPEQQPTQTRHTNRLPNKPPSLLPAVVARPQPQHEAEKNSRPDPKQKSAIARSHADVIYQHGTSLFRTVCHPLDCTRHTTTLLITTIPPLVPHDTTEPWGQHAIQIN